MGFALCVGECINCNNIFSFNPVHVPSVMVDGKREPVCRACMDQVNAIRKEKGLPPLHVFPDAYESCEESELP